MHRLTGFIALLAFLSFPAFASTQTVLTGGKWSSLGATYGVTTTEQKTLYGLTDGALNAVTAKTLFTRSAAAATDATVVTASGLLTGPVLKIGQTATVAGKSIPVSTLIQVGKGTGKVVTGLMRAGGYTFVAGVMLDYMLDKGWNYASDHWEVTSNASACLSTYSCPLPVGTGINASGYDISYYLSHVQSTMYGPAVYLAGTADNLCFKTPTADGFNFVGCSAYSASIDTHAATDADFLSLASDVDSVTPEQMANFGAYLFNSGAPVPVENAATIPTTATSGNSYTVTNADGSTYTVQDIVSLSQTDPYNPTQTDPLTQTATVKSVSPAAATAAITAAETANTTNNTTNNTTSSSTTEESKDPCDTNPDRLGCMSGGEVPDSDLGKNTEGSSISPVSMPGSAVCPAPIQMVTSRGTYMMSWQPVCDTASMLRPLIIAIGWLSGMTILSIGFRKGE